MLLLALVSQAADRGWRGVDMSQICTEDADGSPFRTSPHAKPMDPFRLLAHTGVDTFRMRLWHTPEPDKACAPHAPCRAPRARPRPAPDADTEGMLRVARRCAANNLTFVLDLHLSDTWADPGHQWKPRAWARLSLDELGRAVHNYTASVVAALLAQGTMPTAVQVGNEVNNGLLWANRSAGEPCSGGGQLWCGDAEAQWSAFSGLVAAGIAGVRSACPRCEVAIHTAAQQLAPGRGGAGPVIGWYRKLATGLAAAKPAAAFDRIGLSLYPHWDNGTTFESLAQLPAIAAAFPRTPIYIAETSYPAAGSEQPEAKYAASDAGQLAYLKAVRRRLAEVLGDQNGGVLWWEGAEASWSSLFGSGYSPDRTARYVARPALLEGWR